MTKKYITSSCVRCLVVISLPVIGSSFHIAFSLFSRLFLFVFRLPSRVQTDTMRVSSTSWTSSWFFIVKEVGLPLNAEDAWGIFSPPIFFLFTAKLMEALVMLNQSSIHFQSHWSSIPWVSTQPPRYLHTHKHTHKGETERNPTSIASAMFEQAFRNVNIWWWTCSGCHTAFT